MAITKVSRDLLNTSIVDNGNATAITIDSSENVGIGTSSPAAPLSIEGSSTGEYDALILRNSNAAASGQSAAMIFEVSSGTSGTEAASVAKISGLRTGSGSTGDLLFHTTNAGVSAEAMRIDASGNVLAGKTAVGMANEGIELNSGGYLGITKDSAPCAYLRRNTNDGTIIEFRKDTATVGSIGTQSTANFAISSLEAGHGGLEFGTANIMPLIAGVITDNAMDVGQSSWRFKDAYLSGGVYLGGTGAANKLDDYEEGTFSGTSDGTTYSGEYVKVGKLVTVSFYYDTSSATNNRIAIVPFAATGAVSSANQGQTINRSTSATHPAGTYAAVFSTTSNVYAYNYTGSTLSTPSAGNGNVQFSYYTNF